MLIFFIPAISSYAQNSGLHYTEKGYPLKNKANFADSIHLITFPFLPKRSNEPATIPANFSTCNYGFFCKQELKIEKATKFPIRIRLGSLQQCNYYEGKR